MKKPLPIKTLFVDVGEVLLTNGWDHHARRRTAKNFGLNWAELDQRHRLVFETHEEGKLSFEGYLGRVVFNEQRSFTRSQFRDFMFAQSKPYPKMLGLVAQFKAQLVALAEKMLKLVPSGRTVVPNGYEQPLSNSLIVAKEFVCFREAA